jgi:hypothetical protein
MPRQSKAESTAGAEKADGLSVRIVIDVRDGTPHYYIKTRSLCAIVTAKQQRAMVRANATVAAAKAAAEAAIRLFDQAKHYLGRRRPPRLKVRIVFPVSSRL